MLLAPQSGMKKPVRVGVFSTFREADRAIDGLLAEGFTEKEISVICPQCASPVHGGVHEQAPAGAHAPEAAAAGGALGALVGLLGTAVAITATGGAGLLVAGPLLGGAATGAVAGGFLGAMTTRGFEPEIADFYDQSLEEGKILVAVEDHDEARLRVAERVIAAAGTEPIRLPEG